MKKYILGIIILFFSGQLIAQNRCATMDYLHQEFLQNLAYKTQFDSINKLYFSEAKKLQHQSVNSAKSITAKVRFVPVVVHVLYDSADKNISNQTVYSQIKILNDDYLAMNANLYKTQSDFVNRIGVSAIQFYIADKAPDGSDTVAIIHKHTTAKQFAYNNDVKHTNTKGDTAWNTDKYLNIWVCKIAGTGILGFSSMPGTNLMFNGNDGTVIDYRYFGLSGIANAPYDLGRTATHELGHYFGLYHTFDFGCTAEGDSIKDTPPVLNSNSGCNKGANSCHTDAPDEIDMVENFMDYSDDDCMTMFSKGQVAVMNSVLKHVRDSLGFDSTITFTTQIGIENTIHDKPIVNLYPNPANHQLVISSDKMIDNIELYDMIGKKIFIQLTTENKFKWNAKVESLSSGFYILKLNLDNSATKFIKFKKE